MDEYSFKADFEGMSLHSRDTLSFDILADIVDLDPDAKLATLVIFLGVSIFYLVSTITRYLQWRRHTRQREAMDKNAIQALYTVLTPTSVAWPLLFGRFFKKTAFKNNTSGRCIELDLSELLEHIFNGNLELRDSKDLAPLFRRELQVYGWDLRVALHRNWWFKVANWISKQYFVQAEASSRFTTQGLSSQWPLSCALRVASRSRSSFDLDFVPYYDLQAEISRIQSLHQQGNSTIIEFSCLGPAIGFMSSAFVFCAILFLPSDKCLHRQPTRMNRTSTPLFVKLQDIVALLSSNGTLSIKSIVNISREHVDMLYNLEQELVKNRNLRTEHINDVGLERWREDRLVLAWEAGLLDSKFLMRWRITLGDTN